jgi:hypothetical protein
MEAPVAAARKLELVFCHSVSKSSNHPNEDSFAYDEDRQIFVVSDGASISYDSALWSKILTERFVTNPKIDDEWLRLARQKFYKSHDFSELSWNKQAAFERGSFATLLGLSYDPYKGKAHILGIGDSVIVMIDDTDGCITSFPYEEVSQFRQDPILISTRSEPLFTHAESIRPLQITEHTGVVTLLLMTDAIGAWCLERGYEGAARLTELRDVELFGEFLRTEQQAQKMRIDDATLMVLKLGSAA